MPKAIFNPVQRIFTRRALANLIQSRRQDPDTQPLPRQSHSQPAHPMDVRQRSSFPLTLTVGLMTIGVIAIVSLLQLLFSYLG